MKGIHGETTHMKLEGKAVEIFKKTDHNLYKEHVVYKNNNKFLYVKLKKALYRTIQASLLFWKSHSNIKRRWIQSESVKLVRRQ